MYRRFAILVAILFVLPIVSSMSGCVYYNTFYNAKKEFKQAEKYRKQSGVGTQSGYKNAIDKAIKIIENHPNSKYYDDALYVLGVSYYYTDQPAKSERRFRELLANYPKSKYSKDATLYLARSKLALNDKDVATDLFEEVFQGKYGKEYKSEAAIELGKHYLEAREITLAQSYFLAVRDSLGNEKQRLDAQKYVADAYYDAFKFGDALGAYLQILGMKPDKNDKYHALYQAAQSSYRLQRINAGLDYLQQLIKDPLYFDSLGFLQLAVAQGHEYSGELEQAEAAYLDATESKNSRWVAEAYYQLGLIYQYDYDNLKQAKAYYDKASGGESGQDAMQRSADIAKLQSYTAKENDSTDIAKAREKDTTLTEDQIQDMIDNDAATLFHLAELYWFQLNKPDSAILQLEHLLTRFPSATFAPRAMSALASMRRDYLADTTGADSLLHLAMTQYPQSDYLPEILEQLHMKGSEVDTGYPSYYYHKAENFFVDSSNIDSAMYYYQYVVDHFPKSDYFLQSKFNIVWLQENYRSIGDSSIVLAYKEIADSFPGTPEGTEANRRITYKPPDRSKQRQMEEERQHAEASDTARVKPGQAIEAVPIPEDSTRYNDPRESLYLGPKGEHLILLDAEPVETRKEFDFPAEASSLQGTAWELYYQILLDFSGKVVDYVLKIPSPNDEINRRADLTVASMSFDPLEVNRQMTQKADNINLSEEQEDRRGRWYVLKFIVQKPSYLQ